MYQSLTLSGDVRDNFYAAQATLESGKHFVWLRITCPASQGNVSIHIPVSDDAEKISAWFDRLESAVKDFRAMYEAGPQAESERMSLDDGEA